MIREFNLQWDTDYVRRTTESLQAQADRRKGAAEKNAQRAFIDLLSFMNSCMRSLSEDAPIKQT
jgi:hypothetical protein